MVHFGKYNLSKLYNSFSNIRIDSAGYGGGKRFSYSQRGGKDPGGHYVIFVFRNFEIEYIIISRMQHCFGS